MQRSATRYGLSWSRWTLVTALLFALVARALVPVGYMLVPSAIDPGTLVLTICPSSTVHGLASSGHDHSHHQHHHDKGPAGLDHQLCGFAVAATTDVPPSDVIAVPAYVLLAAALRLPVRDLMMTPSHVGPQLGSRGPPIPV